MKINFCTHFFNIVASVCLFCLLYVLFFTSSRAYARNLYYLDERMIKQGSSSLPPIPPDIPSPPTPPKRDAGRGDPDCLPLARILAPEAYQLGGLTTSSNPNFFVSFPYIIASETPVRIVVSNSSGIVYQRLYSISDLPRGIVQFSLPTERVQLEMQTVYTIQVQVFCKDPSRVNPPSITAAWITRVEENSVQQDLLWYDQLTEFNEVNQVEEWRLLLERGGLGEFKDTPVRVHFSE